MTITKRMYNIPAGTTIYRTTGYIVITSEYDSFHGWYDYNDLECDDDGNLIEVNNGRHVTPSDLIGDEIY